MSWEKTRTYADQYADWKYEVQNGDTLLGWAEWLVQYNEHIDTERR